jgi:DNA-binding transcriptional regulator LsrR (DeoR family)
MSAGLSEKIERVQQLLERAEHMNCLAGLTRHGIASHIVGLLESAIGDELADAIQQSLVQMQLKYKNQARKAAEELFK